MSNFYLYFITINLLPLSFFNTVTCLHSSLRAMSLRETSYITSIRFYCDLNPKTYWKCTSTVITEDIVMTAAHCVDKCQKVNHKIKVIWATAKDKEKQRRRVAKFKIHNKYSKQELQNDIALLFLEESLHNVADSHQALIPKSFVSPGTKAFLAGGEVGQKHLKPKLIKHKVWMFENCDKINTLQPGTFCGSSCSNNYYPLDGDSGSALVASDDESGRIMVVGLVSHRINTQPIVTFFTNVTHYIHWIHKKIDHHKPNSED